MKTNVKVRLGIDDFWFFGPGVYDLLKYIDECGSVARASEKMELSYSKAWKMILNGEKGFGIALVERSTGGKGGGKATLTEEAKKILELFKILNQETQDFAEKRFSELFKINDR